MLCKLCEILIYSVNGVWHYIIGDTVGVYDKSGEAARSA